MARQPLLLAATLAHQCGDVADNLGNDVMIVLAGNGHIQYKYGIPDRTFRLTNLAFRTIYPVAVGENVDLKVADYIWVTKSSKNRQ